MGPPPSPADVNSSRLARRVAGPSHGASNADDIGMNVLLLVATLAGAAMAQGAFQGPSRWLVAAGLVGVLVAALRRRQTATTPAQLLALALGALATWTLVRAFMTDGGVSGLWQAGLMAGLAVSVFAARRATHAEHEALLTAVIVVGVAIASTGWLGAAFRAEPWANPGPSTWRASSTLTYPNAAAALIVVALMIALVRGNGTSLSRFDAAWCTVLFAGLFATQSRGGVVALAVGLVVLTVLGGVTTVVRAAIAPLVGGTIAFGISVPAVDAAEPAQPVVMLVALVVGAVVAMAITHLPRRGTFALALALVTLPVVAWVSRDRFSSTASDRFELTPGERGETTREAIDLIGSNLITGVGPGNVRLLWQSDTRVVTTTLVHNEYLQLVAEVGLVGGVLLAAVILAGCRMLWSSRSCPPRATWIGGTAAIAALAAHSALDFLWHIPVVPLVGAVVFGIVTSGVRATSEPLSSPSTDQRVLVPSEEGHPS